MSNNKQSMTNNKPHGFCETPEEKCTMNYCDENGCVNRKRNLVGDGDPIDTSNYKLSSVYAVTGVDHGSIVTAMNEQQAIEIFQKVYNGEEIICVKDISNYNLENL